MSTVYKLFFWLCMLGITQQQYSIVTLCYIHSVSIRRATLLRWAIPNCDSTQQVHSTQNEQFVHCTHCETDLMKTDMLLSTSIFYLTMCVSVSDQSAAG